MNTSEYHLRAATADDRWSIRWLVLSEGLDPTQIRWSQFWVAEAQGRVVGCGQLRAFDGAQELGSLVVARGYRHQGIGSALTRTLLASATHPVYLECLGQSRAQFYARLGFEVTSLTQLPPTLQRKFALTNRLARLLKLPLVLMKYPETAD